MFTFACPHCRTALSAEPSRIGQKATCGKCRKLLVVPQPPVAVLLPEVPPPVPPAPTRKSWWTARRIAGLVLIVFAGLVISRVGMGILQDIAHHPGGTHIYERQELQSLLDNAPIERVRDELGPPNDYHFLPSPDSGGFTILYYQPGRTRDPATGKRDAATVVLLMGVSRQRVFHVACSPEETSKWLAK